MGIEPTSHAWEARVLPLNDARIQNAGKTLAEEGVCVKENYFEAFWDRFRETGSSFGLVFRGQICQSNQRKSNAFFNHEND